LIELIITLVGFSSLEQFEKQSDRNFLPFKALDQVVETRQFFIL